MILKRFRPPAPDATCVTAVPQSQAPRIQPRAKSRTSRGVFDPHLNRLMPCVPINIGRPPTHKTRAPWHSPRAASHTHRVSREDKVSGQLILGCRLRFVCATGGARFDCLLIAQHPCSLVDPQQLTLSNPPATRNNFTLRPAASNSVNPCWLGCTFHWRSRIWNEAACGQIASHHALATEEDLRQERAAT